MALSASRTGEPIHETPQQILEQVPLAANVKVYAGGLYRYDTSGNLIVPTDAAAQAGKQCVLALEEVDNTGGAAGAKKVDVMAEGVAIVAAGALTAADRGKVAHVTSDNVVATTSTNAVTAGTIKDVRDSRCYLWLGGPR